MPSPSRHPSTSAIVCTILVVAAAVRCLDLQQPLIDAFSWREASTAMMADNFHLRSLNIFFPEVSWTGPGESYQGRELQVLSYITALLYAIFGWHDWLGRLVAVIFGVGSVFGLHRLIACVWDERRAHAGAFMLAIMPGAIFIDRSFLPDPAMLALVTVGSWLYFRYLETSRSVGLLLAASVTVLGVLSKLPGIVVALPLSYATVTVLHAQGVLWSRRLVLIGIVGLLSVVAIAGYYVWAQYLGSTYPPYHVAGSGYIWQDGFGRFAREYFYLPEAMDLASEWFFTLPFLALIGIGLLVGLPDRETNDGRAAWFFHFWLAGVVVVYLAAAREITTNPWNFHVFNVPAAAFAGSGLVALVGVGRLNSSNRVRGLRFLAVASCALWGTFTALTLLKSPYASAGYELGRRLEELSATNDLVIAVAPSVGDPVAIYYSRRRGWVFPPGGGERDWSTFLDNKNDAIKELETLRSQGAVWFGATKNARDAQRRLFTEHHKDLIEHLDRTAERVVDDDVLIYRLAPAAAAQIAPAENPKQAVPLAGQKS